MGLKLNFKLKHASTILDLIIICGVSWLLTGQLVHAAADEDGARLVQERRCYGCHDMKQNLIGPSYQAIAVRHAARKDVMVEVLAEKIVAGGAGNWGLVPMVPNEQVSPAEARIIARWILNLKPDSGGR